MTDWEFLAMQNSTSVRSPQPPLAARLLRPGVATLSALAPALAARVAERLFVTAPRYPAPAHETAVLAGARGEALLLDRAPGSPRAGGHRPPGPPVPRPGGPGGPRPSILRAPRARGRAG